MIAVVMSSTENQFCWVKGIACVLALVAYVSINKYGSP